MATGIRHFLQRRKQTAGDSDYREWEYWNNRSDPNTASGWEAEHLATTIAFIREHVGDARRVFELGPGVGRTLPAYGAGTKIHGYDISNLYKERLMARAGELQLEVTLDVAAEENESLPYEDGEFDIGVACQVFLHQTPQRIRGVMAEMIRVCGKVVVITGGYREAAAAHVFSHDYPVLCTELGCEMNNVRVGDSHIFFTYQKHPALGLNR